MAALNWHELCQWLSEGKTAIQLGFGKFPAILLVVSG
jgi:hypothetical protein